MSEHLIVSQRTRAQRGGHNPHTRLWSSARASIALAVVTLALVAVAGCGGTSGSANTPSAHTGTPPSAGATSAPAHQAGPITEFPLPANSDQIAPYGITKGPNGNLWFTEGASQIGRITPTGTVTEFPLQVASGPQGITAGPDGNLWFTESSSDQIGRITTGK